MAKKNYKKHLPKIGGTAAVALAMTVALSTQAHATEIDGVNTPPVGSAPPVDTGTETNGVVESNVVEPAQANQAIEESNNDILDENEDIIESNEQIEASNDAAAEKNEDATGGNGTEGSEDSEGTGPALPNPDLDLPDAPEFTGNDDMNTDEYNDAVGEYNEDVKEYNEGVDEYNEGVDEYNAAAEEHDQTAQEQYEEDLAEYNAKSAALAVLSAEGADPESEEYKAALATLSQYEEFDEYLTRLNEYEKEKAEIEKANKDAQSAYDEKTAALEILRDAEADPDSEAYKAAMETLAKYPAEYEQYLKELEEYHQGVKDYNDYQNELEDYNGQTDALKKLGEAEVGSAEYLAALDDLAQYEEYQGYVEYLKQALADYNAEKEIVAGENAAAQAEYDTLKGLYDTLTAADPESAEYKAALEKLAEYPEYEEYLKELEEYNQDVKDYSDYQDELKDYNGQTDALKKLGEAEVGSAEYLAALDDLAQYEEYQGYVEYLKQALADYNAEKDTVAGENAVAQAEYDILKGLYDTLTTADKDSDEYQDALEKLAEYPEYEEYLKNLAEHEQLVTENEIYDEVAEYNEGVEANNADIESQNAALENDVDGHADDISGVGQANQNLELEDGVEDTLKSYSDLIEEQAELEAQAKALDMETSGKNAELGSPEYANYLAAVEAYNAAVESFNNKIDSYNEAVEKYNAAVDQYNKNQQNSSSSTTGEAQSTGTADWGNFRDKKLSFNHIDVRYHAAVVKDKEVDDDGKVTYQDSYSKYDVIGVYYDEESATKNPDEFGITYTNTQGSKVEYEMQKDNDHDEFATVNEKYNWMTHQMEIDRTDASANKDTVVTFYATLDDGTDEVKGITVKLDKNSTYAENSYFKYDKDDSLGDFTDSKGRKLQIVEIDGEKYYDVSGQSVFLISALTCDGYDYHLGGLDLVLNMETIIKIYQADKAQTVSYLDKELGMTAQAEKPAEPGTPPTLDKPTLKLDDGPQWNPAAPDAPVEPEMVNEPGTPPILDEPTLKLDNGPRWNPDAPDAPVEPEVVEEPGSAPTAVDPTLDLTEIKEAPTSDFNETEPEAPTPTERLVHADKLQELEEKVVVVIEPTPNPDPGPGPGPGPNPGPDPVKPTYPDPVDPTPDPIELPEEEVPLADQPEVEEEIFEELPDEEVPLSDIPMTGDASAAFGAMSAFSGFGLAVLKLLGRKKRDEE